jgi:hypothetical protein
MRLCKEIVDRFSSMTIDKPGTVVPQTGHIFETEVISLDPAQRVNMNVGNVFHQEQQQPHSMISELKENYESIVNREKKLPKMQVILNELYEKRILEIKELKISLHITSDNPNTESYLKIGDHVEATQ